MMNVLIFFMMTAFFQTQLGAMEANGAGAVEEKAVPAIDEKVNDNEKVEKIPGDELRRRAADLFGALYQRDDKDAKELFARFKASGVTLEFFFYPTNEQLRMKTRMKDRNGNVFDVQNGLVGLHNCDTKTCTSIATKVYEFAKDLRWNGTWVIYNNEAEFEKIVSLYPW